jgi:hypothetical protein
MPLKLDFESWEPCPFNKVSDCSQAHISNFLGVQKEGTHVGMSKCGQNFMLTQNVGQGAPHFLH